MTPHGQNIIVLDLETLHSAADCVSCEEPMAAHARGNELICAGYEAIGWHDHRALGLSIGCLYDYADGRFWFFDQHTLRATMHRLIVRQPLLVTYNGKQFDLPLMLACVDDAVTTDGEPATDLPMQWYALRDASYDLLHEIWQVDPVSKFQKGNGLDAVSQANGYGAKEIDGSAAPRLWAQGRYAEVINYCASDVWKTRLLFEQVCRGEPLKRPAGPVLLPLPSLLTEETTP